MKILLVPWEKSFHMALRVYAEGFRYLNDYRASISARKSQTLALSLIQNYATFLRLTTFKISFRMAVEADIPDCIADRLLFILTKLGEVHNSRHIPDDLIEHPTLENVERFLSIRALAGEKAALGCLKG